ncbi:CAP domain-containing protein [Pseudoclavibacter chungangensis]|uniref:CAP domain-containing protein n=2 Tax=Pseudoclavibacter chungangensis TaxID=587635 RepID=A0A7J5BYM7_9MICO|nr:CAP domain-containing protein [Pseudoclavibacter chungangensis]
MPLAFATGARPSNGNRPMPAKIVWGALVALVLGVVAVVLAPATIAHAAPTDEAREIIELTNTERAGAGAGPVQHSDALQAVAQDWAEHLAAEGGGISHNPSYAEQVPAGWSGVAENVASGGTSPQVFHDMWVRSEGHYRNLMNPDFNVMGVGWATSAAGTVYAVEVFAKYDEITDALGATPVDATPTEDTASTSAESTPAETEATTPDTATTDAETAETTATPSAETPTATSEAVAEAVTPTATTTEAATPPGSSGGLADTGTSNFTLLAVGASLALLLGAGALFVVQRRRRSA